MPRHKGTLIYVGVGCPLLDPRFNGVKEKSKKVFCSPVTVVRLAPAPTFSQVVEGGGGPSQLAGTLQPVHLPKKGEVSRKNRRPAFCPATGSSSPRLPGRSRRAVGASQAARSIDFSTMYSTAEEEQQGEPSTHPAYRRPPAQRRWMYLNIPERAPASTKRRPQCLARTSRCRGDFGGVIIPGDWSSMP